MSLKCAVPGCPSNRRKTFGTGIRFFSIPRSDLARREQWIQACGNSIKLRTAAHAEVCSKHFRESDFKLQYRLLGLPDVKYHHLLKRDAVPSLGLPPRVPGSSGATMATSTLYRGSPLGPHPGSPGSCNYLPRQLSTPKADWRTSFANISTANPLSLILRQHNGVWLPGSTDNSSTTTKQQQQQQQPQLVKENAVVQETEMSPSKSRMSLGKVTKILRCQVCRSIVKDNQFHNHLFFGPVRCEVCFIVCQECPVFEQLSQEAELESDKCQHRFWYCEDPYDYLCSRLSGSSDQDLVAISAQPHNLRLLQKYVKNLENLQLRQPWSDAIRRCKRRLLKTSTSSSEPSEDAASMDKSPPPSSQSLRDVTCENLPSTSSTNNDTHGDNEEPEISIIEDMQGRSECPSSVGKVLPTNENSSDSLLLTQSYDLEHLEQEVEYVKLDMCGAKSSEPSSEIPHEKRRYRKRRKLSHNKIHRVPTSEDETQQTLNQRQEEEEELVLEQVEMPENGHYLMVRGTVEECPMCYEGLDPTMCTVNMRTYLLTVHCPVCKLIIYMVPDLPGGLRIVTEDNTKGVAMAQPKAATEDNTKGVAMAQPKAAKVKSRRISPRDFFAS